MGLDDFILTKDIYFMLPKNDGNCFFVYFNTKTTYGFEMYCLHCVYEEMLLNGNTYQKIDDKYFDDDKQANAYTKDLRDKIKEAYKNNKEDENYKRISWIDLFENDDFRVFRDTLKETQVEQPTKRSLMKRILGEKQEPVYENVSAEIEKISLKDLQHIEKICKITQEDSNKIERSFEQNNNSKNIILINNQ